MNLYDNLNKMMAYIEEHIEEKIERNVLAKFLGCSAYTPQRIFSMMTGFTVSDYIRRRRMSLAVLKLKEKPSHNFLVFINVETGKVNAIHKLKDGKNYGLVEPEA